MAEDKQNKRPKFSAPKPPSGKDDVLVNAEETRPITDTVIETPDENTIPLDTSPTAPKVVSKTNDNSNSIDSVLSEKNTQKISSPAPEATPPNTPPKSKPAKEASHCNAVLVGITAFSLIIGIAGWFLYFSTSSGNPFTGSSQNTPTPTVTPAAVTPTPATSAKTAITLEVLNGSGVSGLAGKTAATLEGMGYTVLETGNADSSNYKTTEIYTNPEFTDTTAFLEDLEEEFGSATVSGSLKDSTASARIIVGKDWAE